MDVLSSTRSYEKRSTTNHRTPQVPSLTTSRPHPRARLSALLSRYAGGRLRTSFPPNQAAELLARTFGHAEGAGFIGPGAHDLLRAILTEALTTKTGVSWVIATKHDLQSLGTDAFDDATLDRFSSRLLVTETLEDTIERLEFEADVTRALDINKPLTTEASLLWFSSPGPDADVVHQTLDHWPGTSLTALIAGPWPYGPTHLIETDGPRPLPQHPVRMLSVQQAVAELHQTPTS
ncbi:hypothetical protein [Actinomadura opuntiae]|uniref:hypothetical protein n=1 Tax=Actinomadura sp. OS1-43 TaxID=604315 RepID=UPI00255B0B0E|nr:hypothetical protein [Actinomadura sp. OS1-43]MDL4813204.1 hypothetical protein [Actinomadura sp. OS1-43]